MRAARWTRRRFIVSTAVAACAGCTAGATDRGVRAVEADRSDRSVVTGGPDGAAVAGALDEVLPTVQDSGAVYVPEARAWLVPFPAGSLVAARSTYPVELHAGLEAGLIALYQKCPHLGCRVPYSTSSGWFECPCHGSQFGSTGEHRGGPSPRGMDAYPIRIDDGVVMIDTRQVVDGLDRRVSVVDDEPVGAHCVGDAED